MLFWFQPSITSRNSLSPQTNFQPLSDLTSSGCPLRAITRHMALIKEFPSRLCATSKCMALMDQQVNKTPYLFTWLLALRTTNGPKQSTPTNVKGGFSGVTRSVGKSVICCSPNGACLLLQSKQPRSTLLTAVLALRIQNLSRIKDSTCSRPE